MSGNTADVSLSRGHGYRGVWTHLRVVRLAVLLTSPLIYLGLLPFLFLDLFVAVYQAICFPANGIPKVRRSDYLIFDCGRLPYLNLIEKAGCIYCSYANGLLAYVREIAARTEQHFCPIRHAAKVPAPHSRYSHFVPYGDARAYHALVGESPNAFTDIQGRDERRS